MWPVCWLVVVVGGGGGEPATPVSIPGKVIDGYIYGAKVCLDIVHNLKCDPGEPFDISKPDGSYSISYDGKSGPASGFVVVAEVLSTSYDLDDKVGNEWRTLEEAGKSPFNLAAPAVSSQPNKEVLMTPLTTLVTHELLSDKTASVSSQQAVKAANDAVKTKLGLKESDLMTLDFAKDTSKEEVKKVAQVTAAALAEVNRNVQTQLQTQANTDTSLASALNKTETLRNAQVAAVKTVLDTVMPTVMDKDAGKLATSDVKTAVAQIKADINKTEMVAGVVNNIVIGTKSGDSSVVQITDVLRNGFVMASLETFHLYDDSKPANLGQWIGKRHLLAEYLMLPSSTAPTTEQRLAFYQGAWVRTADWGTDHALTRSGTWVPDDFSPQASNLVFDQNCATLKRNADVESEQKLCLTERNLAGILIQSLTANYCSITGSAAPESCKTATYPADARGYDMTASSTADRYTLSVPNSDESKQWHYGNQWGNNREATSIADFLGLLRSEMGSSTTLGIWNNFQISLASWSASENKGTLNWFYQDSDTASPIPSGTSSIKLVTVNNQPLLVFTPAAEYHRRNSGDMVGKDFVFGAFNQKIRMGRVEYANVKEQLQFGAVGWAGNKAAFDAFMKGIGQPLYPFQK